MSNDYLAASSQGLSAASSFPTASALTSTLVVRLYNSNLPYVRADLFPLPLLIPRMLSQLVSPCYPLLDSGHAAMTILGLSPDTYSVLAVASARIYHAQLTTKIPEWCYSRMRGTLVFGKDNKSNDLLANRAPVVVEPTSYWFRLLDETSGRPIWIFKIPTSFAYELDRPFFHAFQGKSRRFGFLFENDEEAGALAKKVISQTCPPRQAKNRTLSLSMRSKSPSGSGQKPIVPSMVSLPTPNSFVHVGHVGLNKDGVIEASKGIDPSWKAVLEGHSLRDHGRGPLRTSEPEKLSFSEGFWRGLGTGTDENSTTGVNNPAVTQSGPDPQPKIRRRNPAPSFTMF